MFYGKSCSEKFHNIHRKRPVLESLFNNAEGLNVCNIIRKRLEHRCFHVNIAKFLRTAFDLVKIVIDNDKKIDV